MAQFANRDVKDVEAIVLRMLNDHTPLPKDLQLLILDYWRPICNLIVYNVSGLKFERDMVKGGDSRTSSSVEPKDWTEFRWTTIPYDSRIKVPSPFIVLNGGVTIKKFNQGFLAEYSSTNSHHSDYYPSIWSTEHQSITSAFAYHQVVAGVKEDVLFGFSSIRDHFFKYDFEGKGWCRQEYPDQLKQVIPKACPPYMTNDRVYFDDAAKFYSYDGKEWKTGYKQSFEGPSFIVGKLECYKITNYGGDDQLMCYSMETNKLVRTKYLPKTDIIITVLHRDSLLILSKRLLYTYNPITDETTPIEDNVTYNHNIDHRDHLFERGIASPLVP